MSYSVKNNSSRSSHTLSTRKKVWNKAAEMLGHPPDTWRKDHTGRPMNWQEYMNPECNNGWKIVHITAIEDGGTDEPDNLRAQNIHS